MLPKYYKMIEFRNLPDRSGKQNRYYHGVVVASILNYSQWRIMYSGDANDVHEWIKFTFGVTSTTMLAASEFETLMETIRNHAKKYWGLIIPLPNE